LNQDPATAVRASREYFTGSPTRSHPIPAVIPSPNITPFHGANISTFQRADLLQYLGGNLHFCADHFVSHSAIHSALHMLK